MLFLRTFGGLSLENGGRPIVGAGTQRARLALLAVLATAGDNGISRDRLLALFWPESDADRARGALKQALYAMRRDVAERELTVGTTELRLNPLVISSDVGEFDRAIAAGDLETAVALHRGLFLDGIYLKDSPEFERWAERERTRLAHSYRGGLETLAKVATANPDSAKANDWLRMLTTADPLSARYALAYMQSLVDSNDREAAIRHGLAYTTLVREELTVEPDPIVPQFVEQLRASYANGGTPAPPPPVVATTAAEMPVDLPTATRRLRAATRSVPVALGVVVMLALGVFALSRPKTESRLVVVPPFENATSDASLNIVGKMVADWVTQGLAQTGLVEVVDSRTALRSVAISANDSMSRYAGANLIVRGIVYRQRDSVTIQTQIVSVNDGRVLFQAAPVTGRQDDPRPIAEGVRQRVMGAFAAFADKKFADWEHAVSQPPSYDAYQEFMIGLELSAQAKMGEAYVHFISAAQHDTEFVHAKVYALLTGPWADDSLRFNADSLRRAAESQRSRLTRYDRLTLDRSLAEDKEDWEAAFDASRQLVQIAPRSAEAVLLLVQDAVATNRFRAAIDALNELGENRGWLGDGPLFVRWQGWAHHLAGDFEGELAADRRARARFPDRPGFCYLQIRPLAALGREAAVDSLMKECSAMPNALPLGSQLLLAGTELQAHGHDAAGRRALVRARAWYSEHMPGRSDVLALIAWRAGEWEQVRDYWRSELSKHPIDARGYAQLGAASAHLGDRTTATAMDARLDSLIRTDEQKRRRRRHGHLARRWSGGPPS